MIQIEIAEQAYQTLSTWASVGRTIDAAIGALLDLGTDHEQAQWTIGELEALKYALDDCNRAAKNRR
jgi:hypothetical protein